jgi:hypothetical protein
VVAKVRAKTKRNQLNQKRKKAIKKEKREKNRGKQIKPRRK